MTLYYVRRHLGFSRAEWEALPWHDQRLYIEGLNSEGESQDPDGAGTPQTGEQDLDLASVGLGELAGVGWTVGAAG